MQVGFPRKQIQRWRLECGKVMRMGSYGREHKEVRGGKGEQSSCAVVSTKASGDAPTGVLRVEQERLSSFCPYQRVVVKKRNNYKNLE